MLQSPSDDLTVDIDNHVIDEKTASGFTGGALDAIDLGANAHARIMRKLDWHLLPLVTLLYLLSFM